MTIQLHR